MNEETELTPCYGLTEMFFITTISGRPGEQKAALLDGIRKAKEICQTCDLKTECLKGALMRNETIGIWGGVNLYDRLEKKNARKLMGIR